MEPRELLRGMLEIPSPSGGEAPLASYLATVMEEAGLDGTVDGAGNAVGRRGDASAPMILLLGHLDTIDSPLPVRQEGSRLYGRGAVDAKGPLAAMISAAARFQPDGVQLVVAGAVEEEVPSSRGARYLLERYEPAAVLIGEPSGWSNVVIGYKGRIGIHYEVERPPTHTAGPGEKANEVAVAFWQRLVAHLASLNGAGNGTGAGLFYRPMATLNRFEGDIERARLYISCRTPPGFDFEAFDRFLATAGPQTRLEVEERTPAVLVERNEPTARALVQSIRSQGGSPGFTLKTGTSDMNVVAERWRVPIAAYGPGDSSLDHTAEEHVDVDEYLRAIEVLGGALTRLSGELKQMHPESVYSEDDEQALQQRLRALGYLG